MDGLHLHPTRRTVVVAATLASAAPALLAQTSKRLRKFGFLNVGAVCESGPRREWTYRAYFDAYFDELERLGWVESRDYTYEQRCAQGDLSKLEALAAELAARGVEVILANTDPEALAALRGAPKLPIVVTIATDPVNRGYAKSLSHPGGNVTGLTWEQDVGIGARYVQFLKEYVPEMKRLGILHDPQQAGQDAYLEVMTRAARKLGMTVDVVRATQPAQLEAAFASLVKLNVQALLCLGSQMTFQESRRIVTLARKYRLPDIGIFPEAVEMGGLMSYGVDRVDLWRRSAGYVDKILKGAKPGDLPMEQPTKYDFVINLKTAKELGRPVPKTLLAQATRLIE